MHIWRCELSFWRWRIYSEITLNCVEHHKGPCGKLFTKVHQFDIVLTDTENMMSHYMYIGLCQIPKHSLQNKIKLEILMRKIQEKFYILCRSISIWCYLLFNLRLCFMISSLTAYIVVYIPYWSTVKSR